MERLNSILLIDDNKADNYFHEKIIKRVLPDVTVIKLESGIVALEYLTATNPKNLRPNLIFLDINMPKMNGWEFLEQYKQLDDPTKDRPAIIMLTTSYDHEDEKRVEDIDEVRGFMVKPLTESNMKLVMSKLAYASF